MSECVKDGTGNCTRACFDCLNPDAAQAIDRTLQGGDDFNEFIKSRLPEIKAPEGLFDRIKFSINQEDNPPPPNAGDITQN